MLSCCTSQILKAGSKFAVFISLAWLSVSSSHAYVVCPPGTYAQEGADVCTLAPIGYYVPMAGATEPTIAPAGTYVSFEGAIAPTLAPPGFYESEEGQSFATAAQAGYFASGSGSTEQTIAPAGYYTSMAGSAAPIAAPAGTYVSEEGQTGTILAEPGYFASGPASTQQTPAPPGYYTPGPGLAEPIAVPPGTYAPGEANTFGIACPQDSTSFGAAPACRSGMLSVLDPTTVSPEFDSSFGTGGTYNLGLLDIDQLGVLNFSVTNISSDLGYADMLTDLSLLSADISGTNEDLFSLDGFVAGEVLSELEETSFGITYSSAVDAFFNIALTFTTDQYASFGVPGQEFIFNFYGRFTYLPNKVSSPQTFSLIGLFLLLTLVSSRVKQSFFDC